VVRKLSENFENNEVIFVCDGHTEVCEQSINDILKRLELNIMAETVQMAYYQGMEASMCAGDDFAIGDFLFEFDSIEVDYDTQLVIDVFNRAREGYDIVSAGDNKMSFASRVFYKLINFRNPYVVRHESFRIVSRRAINRIKILNNTIPYRKMLYAACGLPNDHINYIPVKSAKSRKRNNKELSYRLNSGINYTIIFTKLMENITYIMSCIFLLVSIGTGIWALYSYWVEDNVVAGWVSLMGVISFGFFGIFLLLSVIVKYMSLILDINYKKTSYVVETANKNLK
jgi:dolichol-phosphate mannosyltransferase